MGVFARPGYRNRKVVGATFSKAFEIICHSGRIGSSLKEKQVQKNVGFINMIFFI